MVAKIQFSDIKIERLSLNDSNIFQSFSCDNERLDTFFQEEIVPFPLIAIQNSLRGCRVKVNDTIFLKSSF